MRRNVAILHTKLPKALQAPGQVPRLVVGDAKKDVPLQTVKVTAPYPHGIAIHNGIDPQNPGKIVDQLKEECEKALTPKAG